jgi:hypothetical protein
MYKLEKQVLTMKKLSQEHCYQANAEQLALIFSSTTSCAGWRAIARLLFL